MSGGGSAVFDTGSAPTAPPFVVVEYVPREILEVAVVEGGVETLLTEDDWVYEAAENTVYLEPGVASATLQSIRVDYTPE